MPNAQPSALDILEVHAPASSEAGLPYVVIVTLDDPEQPTQVPWTWAGWCSSVEIANVVFEAKAQRHPAHYVTLYGPDGIRGEGRALGFIRGLEPLGR